MRRRAGIRGGAAVIAAAAQARDGQEHALTVLLRADGRVTVRAQWRGPCGSDEAAYTLPAGAGGEAVAFAARCAASDTGAPDGLAQAVIAALREKALTPLDVVAPHG